MTALSEARRVEKRDGLSIALEVKASNTVYQGGLVMLDAGKAVPASKSTGKTILGVAENTAKGGETVTITKGTYGFENKTGDLVTLSEIGSDCYVADDQTVAKSSTGSSKAGKVIDVSEGQVWVQVG